MTQSYFSVNHVIKLKASKIAALSDMELRVLFSLILIKLTTNRLRRKNSICEELS